MWWKFQGYMNTTVIKNWHMNVEKFDGTAHKIIRFVLCSYKCLIIHAIEICIWYDKFKYNKF